MLCRKSICSLLAGICFVPAVFAATERFEAESYVVNREKLCANTQIPGSWNIWSKDRNARKWSGGVVLQSVYLSGEKPLKDAAVLKFRLPVSGEAPVQVYGRIERTASLSLDGGKTWTKCTKGILIPSITPKNGVIEFQMSDHLFGGEPGSVYIDYFDVSPVGETCDNNALNLNFSRGLLGAAPEGWAIWKRVKEDAVNALLTREDGRICVLVSAETTKDWNLKSRALVPLEQGKTYRFTCEGKLVKDMKTVRLQLVVLDAAGKELQQFSYPLPFERENWKTAEFTLTPAKNGTDKGLIRLAGSGETGFYLSGIQLMEIGK